jgi:hypothetical protein
MFPGMPKLKKPLLSAVWALPLEVASPARAASLLLRTTCTSMTMAKSCTLHPFTCPCAHLLPVMATKVVVHVGFVKHLPGFHQGLLRCKDLGVAGSREPTSRQQLQLLKALSLLNPSQMARLGPPPPKQLSSVHALDPCSPDPRNAIPLLTADRISWAATQWFRPLI